MSIQTPNKSEPKSISTSLHSCNFCHQTGQMRICGQCKKVRYCGQECQKKDWTVHKLSCAILKVSSSDSATIIRQQPVSEIKKNLEILNGIKELKFPNSATEQQIYEVIITNPQLESLSFSASENVTDRLLKHIAKLSNLTSLDLSLCINITDAGLFYLKDMHLKHLNLNFCRLITDKGLSNLKDLPLEGLVLNTCTQLTDTGFKYLKGLPLKKLGLSCCNVTISTLEILKTFKLEMLNLNLCRDLTKEALEKFLEENPELKITSHLLPRSIKERADDLSYVTQLTHQPFNAASFIRDMNFLKRLPKID